MKYLIGELGGLARGLEYDEGMLSLGNGNGEAEKTIREALQRYPFRAEVRVHTGHLYVVPEAVEAGGDISAVGIYDRLAFGLGNPEHWERIRVEGLTDDKIVEVYVKPLNGNEKGAKLAFERVVDIIGEMVD